MKQYQILERQFYKITRKYGIRIKDYRDLGVGFVLQKTEAGQSKLCEIGWSNKLEGHHDAAFYVRAPEIKTTDMKVILQYSRDLAKAAMIVNKLNEAIKNSEKSS